MELKFSPEQVKNSFTKLHFQLHTDTTRCFFQSCGGSCPSWMQVMVRTCKFGWKEMTPGPYLGLCFSFMGEITVVVG